MLMSKFSIFVLILSFFTILDSALAYIDPGTGSMILQIVVAVFIGAIFTIKSFWYKITSFFSGKKTKNSSSENEVEK